MLNLDHYITMSKEVIDSPNLCDRFTDDDLKKIGNEVFQNYTIDVDSRDAWTRRTEAAMDLALQIQKAKTWPWAGCSNIAFPLVTIAAMQFHSRAYPALVNGRKIVNCQIVGTDPDGAITKRAERVSRHMSWQLLEQDETWEEQQDRALINIPIVGVAFKKSYYSNSKGHNVSDLVLAKDLVINYWAKTVEDAQVKTHVIPMYRNEIHERVLRGSFRDILEEEWFESDAQVNQNRDNTQVDNRAGLEEPITSSSTPYTLLEQHCVLDLDDDGYAEPYIVTLELSTQTVLRIVTRFERIEDIEYTDAKNPRIIRINGTEYFTKIPFIPNPDGSLMDIGFGTLIGPLNESVNSTLNQMFDAGTMANTAGGFLGRGAKIRGGNITFNPFEWNRVDATGDDLRKSIYPLPVREPSMVMFQLLGFLVEYVNRISGSTDTLMGENPGQNTPAETSRSMVEQGTKVYSAIFKRVWRSMKMEFRKLYTLNAIYLPESISFGADSSQISREDYSGGATVVVPSADPLITSDGARFAQARMVREAAASAAGYNGDAVERMYLSALQVDNVDEIFPGAAGQQAPEDVKLTIAKMKMQLEQAKLQTQQQQFMLTLQTQQGLNNAKIAEIQAQIFKIMEQGKAESSKQQINAFNAAIQAMREQNNQVAGQLKFMTETMNNEQGISNTGGGPVQGMAPASDDLSPETLGLPEEGEPEGGLGNGELDSQL